MVANIPPHKLAELAAELRQLAEAAEDLGDALMLASEQGWQAALEAVEVIERARLRREG